VSERRPILGLAAAAVIALTLFGALRVRESRALERGPKLAWQSWEAGFAEARQSGKRVVALFGATWCRPCRELERKTLTRPWVVRALRRGFVTIHVDVDSEPDRAKQWFVRSLPTLAVLTAEEEIVDLMPGYQTPREMVRWLGHAREAEPRRMPNFGSTKGKKGSGD